MKFSVIIPTYKGQKSIGIAIQSVLEQNYKDYEIIVCDDNPLGSIDQMQTEQIISSFNNKTIIYLKNGHKNGSAARNYGIKKACGDIIAFLDDDDFYLKGYLEEANLVFTNNSDIDILFFDVVIISKEGISRKVSYPNITSKDLLFSKQEIGTGSNICFRKHISDTILFDERYQRHQDIEFVSKIINKYNHHWVETVKIVKYFNNIDNFPNIELAINMQKLLRNDMLKSNILTKEECCDLEINQLSLLFNDLLIRKVPVKEIRKIKKELKNLNNFTLFKELMLISYSFSKNIFCWVAKKYINNKKNGLTQLDTIIYTKYREKLLSEVPFL